MNWRRGLFRFWIVGAALFVIAVASMSYSNIKAQFEWSQYGTYAPDNDWSSYGTFTPHKPALTQQPEAAPWDDFPDVPPGVTASPNPWASVGLVAGIAFGVPLVVLVLGAPLVWAFSGFVATRP